VKPGDPGSSVAIVPPGFSFESEPEGSSLRIDDPPEFIPYSDTGRE